MEGVIQGLRGVDALLAWDGQVPALLVLRDGVSGLGIVVCECQEGS